MATIFKTAFALGYLCVLPSAHAAGHGAMAMPAKTAYVTFRVHGAVGTYPVHINSSGTVAGWWSDSKSVQHGFIRTSDGAITTFDVPGADSTVPNDIDKNADIVGYYTSKGRSRGFLRTSNGKFSTIDIRRSKGTYAEDIETDGTIVGFYTTRTGAKGFQLTRDGTLVTFACKGATDTRAYAVHKGDILGECNGGGASHGFVRSTDGHISSFAVGKSPLDISPNAMNSNQAAGAWTDKRSNIHAFIFDRGSDAAATFDLGNGKDTEAMSLTTEGVMAGYFSDGTTDHGFLRAPDGTVTVLDVPKSRATFLIRMDKFGEGTGYYRTRTGRIDGFLVQQ